MDGKIKLRFGKYRGKYLRDIPDSYLQWCLDNSMLRGTALDYVIKRLKNTKTQSNE